MSQSPLSMRCDIVKAMVEKEFAHLPDLERRRMETTILQILAPIYAPPRSATPVAVEHIFRVALDAKQSIDAKETQRLKENNPQLIRPIPRRPTSVMQPLVVTFAPGSGQR